jgi:hypothetical protein
MERVAGDYYPEGGTPQMALDTIVSLGAEQADFETPLAGLRTMLLFELSPGSGLERYLGAWGHLLAASADLIEVMHTHPFIADGGTTAQLNVTFPRPGNYRLWAQFQRRGRVNTAAFTLRVKAPGGRAATASPRREP